MFKEFWSKRKKLCILAGILILAGFGGWRVFGNRQQQFQYQTAKVEKGTLIVTVTASGKAAVTNMADIATNASGVVKKVYVKDGDSVKQNQKIAEIELDMSGKQKNSAALSSYLSAKNSVDSANATFYTLQSDMFSKWDIFRKLAESSSYDTPEKRALPEFHIAEKNWLAAEAKYKNQQAVLTQTKASLNDNWWSYRLASGTIAAPIAGAVGSLNLVPGLTLAQSTMPQRVGVIQNESNPILIFNLSEIDVPKVKIGQQSTVTFDSLTGKTFTGKVMAIDRIGTVSNGVTSYPATIQLDVPTAEILPNMAAGANIILDIKTDVLLVSSAAIQIQGGESVVKILKDGQEQQIIVQTGVSSDLQTEIISGISEGDMVITGTTGSSSTQPSSSVFSGGMGGGALRPGGFGGGTRGGGIQH